MMDDFNARINAALRDAAWSLEEVQTPKLPPPISVTKTSAYLPVSDEVLMDSGAIPDIRPRVKTPWRRRLHWRWLEWRERVGRKVGGWIAGVDLSERDDW